MPAVGSLSGAGQYRTARHRDHLLALPFSEDSCASDQRLLFPSRSFKIILNHLLASLASEGRGGGEPDSAVIEAVI